MTGRFSRSAMLFCGTALATSIIAWDIAQAQVEEVVVTARKREEKLVDAPVAITAFTMQDIQRYDFENLEQISTQVPSLIVDKGFGATGGSLSLRGISTGTSGFDFDQAVSSNIDGVVQSKSTTLLQGFFDVDQIEVLKGPQALFFGKNSPAGIISFRTADPTDDFEALVKSSYDFRLGGETEEGIVSGPIGGDWGARLAVQYQHQDGAYKNLSPGATPGNVEALTDYFGRATLKGSVDRLEIRAKISYGNSRDSYVPFQSFFCPNTPAPGDDCKPGSDGLLAPDASPLAASAAPYNRNGVPQDRLQTVFGTLEMSYDLGDLKLTSVSGLNYFDRGFVSYDPDSISILGPNFLVGAQETYNSITEEVRLASEFQGPFQFMTGAFYQHAVNSFAVDITLPFAAPLLSSFGLPVSGAAEIGRQTDDTDAYSFFGQLSYDILPGLNLSGGARYTEEDKTGRAAQAPFSPLIYASEGYTGPPYTGVDYSGLRLNASNTSPEATLRWKPEDNLTFYGSYKQGFKSGGFNAVAVIMPPVPPLPPLSFRPEHVAGFELGAKSLLLDNQLAVDVAAFSYVYRDLQVSTFNASTDSVQTINAARAETQGVEGDATWAPEMFKGLQLNAAFTYLHARFKSYLATCYVGQSIAAGCNQEPLLGVFQTQNAAGKQLINAPDFSGNIDASYEAALTDSWEYGLSLAGSYKGNYNPSDDLNPFAEQQASWVLDASARLTSADGQWEIAVIGRNLTDVFRASFAAEVTDADTIAHGTGTATTAPANLYGIYGEPRNVEIQLTWHY